MAPGDQVDGIDSNTLTPIVRRVFGSDTAEVLDWKQESLMVAGKQNAATQGVYRCSGLAADRGETRRWSVILKIASTATDNKLHAEMAWREPLAYESGLLDDLPGPVRAPRCFGVDRLVDRVRIWLEEVEDAYGGDWPLSRYALAARHLGQMNGAYLVGESLPTAPWLCRDFARTYAESWMPLLAQYPAIRDEPLALELWPAEVGDAVLRLAAERGAFLDALDRLPRTLCHFDAFKQNLIARRLGDGTEETVAVDWGFAGIGGIGEELAAFVAATGGLCPYDLDRMHELEDTALDGYLTGLRDVGWNGDPRLVRFGYLVLALLRYALCCLPATAVGALRQSGGRRLAEERVSSLGRWANVQRFLIARADEARELLPLLE